MLKKLLSQQSFRKRMIIVTILLFVPLFSLAGTLMYYASSNSIRNAVIKKNISNTRNVMAQVDNSLKEMESVTLSTIIDPNFQKLMEEDYEPSPIQATEDYKWIRLFFISMRTINKDITGISLFKGGQNLYQHQAFGVSDVSHYDYTTDFWYQKTMNRKGQALIIGTHPNRHTSADKRIPQNARYIYSIARQINNFHSSRPLGFIKIDQNLAIIERIIKQYNDEESRIIIIDDEGNIVYHYNYDMLTKKLDSIMDTNRVFSSESGHYIDTIDNTKSLITFCTSNYSQWRAISIMPESISNQQPIFIRNFTVIIIVSGLLIAVCLFLFISKSISYPIERLNASMNEVKYGNLNIQLEPVSNDEIGNLTLTFNKMIQDLKTLINKEYLERFKRQEAELKRKQAELAMLQHQINPHFLYNTLESIRITAALNHDHDVADMTYTLAKFFRLSISKGEELTYVSNEIDLIKNYLKIQQFRYKDKFDCVFQLPDGIEDLKMPRLILQPIVENAIFHGLELKKGKGHIIISGKINHNNLVMTIIDNGVGIPIRELDHLNNLFSHKKGIEASTQAGIGMVNVHERITLAFGSGYGVRLTANKPKGLIVTITLPKITP